MQRRISDIRKELKGPKARGEYTPEMLRQFHRKSAWNKGVCNYAEELFDNYLDRRDLLDYDDEARIGKIAEKDLLNGAADWNQYSHGGCSLIYDEDICMALCSPKEQKRTHNGELPPNDKEDWLDVQARALQQAATLVLKAVNRR